MEGVIMHTLLEAVHSALANLHCMPFMVVVQGGSECYVGMSTHLLNPHNAWRLQMYMQALYLPLRH